MLQVGTGELLVIISKDAEGNQGWSADLVSDGVFTEEKQRLELCVVAGKRVLAAQQQLCVGGGRPQALRSHRYLSPHSWMQ